MMTWTENVIIGDANYIDRVAFDLTVNFERMIGRRIPPADMSRWVECIALDGGMRPSAPAAAGDASPVSSPAAATRVVPIHDAARRRLENFAPSDYAGELDGQAFTGPLGEFLFTCVSPEDVATREALFLETLQLALQAKEVRRLMVIPDGQAIDDVRRVVRQTDDSDTPKRITVFTMQPVSGGHFTQEILGYSLMAALGVKSSELERICPEEGTAL